MIYNNLDFFQTENERVKCLQRHAGGGSATPLYTRPIDSQIWSGRVCHLWPHAPRLTPHRILLLVEGTKKQCRILAWWQEHGNPPNDAVIGGQVIIKEYLVIVVG